MSGDAGVFVCDACGKRYKWSSSLAGRTAHCSCGEVVRVPMEEPGLVAQAAGSGVRRGARPAPAADASIPLDARLAAERMRKRAEAERREREEGEAELGSTSPFRDRIAPVILIAIGISLLFTEAMMVGKTPAASVPAAAPGVALSVVMKTGLMLLGMFAATQVLDVTLVGALPGTILKICAIAIGPAAVKGLLLHRAGASDMNGILLGIFISVAIYAGLFRLLLKTDARNTAICVTLTWVLLTLVDYLSYKLDSINRGSWI
jgi:hypothetical protein